MQKGSKSAGGGVRGNSSRCAQLVTAYIIHPSATGRSALGRLGTCVRKRPTDTGVGAPFGHLCAQTIRPAVDRADCYLANRLILRRRSPAAVSRATISREVTGTAPAARA